MLETAAPAKSNGKSGPNDPSAPRGPVSMPAAAHRAFRLAARMSVVNRSPALSNMPSEMVNSPNLNPNNYTPICHGRPPGANLTG